VTDVLILNFDGGNQLRRAMSEVCQNRWHMEPGCRISVLTSKSANFHIEGKRMAEQVARSPIYVVADNDCLILGENFVRLGIEIMGKHPEYGLLAATSICDGHFPSGRVYSVMEEVVPMQAGGVAFVRKGILKEFNDCQPNQVDDSICSEMKRKGHLTGYMPSLRMNHIGAGYSISSPTNWMRVPG
jgi:hypothetical protein